VEDAGAKNLDGRVDHGAAGERSEIGQARSFGQIV
jgi:hypothetical protein